LSFYFGQALANSGALYDPFLAPFISRDQAEAVRTQRGGTAFAIYPFSRYTRVELFTGYTHLSETFRNTQLQDIADEFQERTGSRLFRTGHMIPIGLSLVNETTIFREYGPVAGRTYKLSYDASPNFGDAWLSRQTIEADARHYYRVVANGVLATRLRAFKSWGSQPDLFSYGGNSEMRGYEYLQFIGQQAFFANAELRFPVIEAMLTPLGVLGGLRGVFFANLGASGFNNQPFKLLTRSSDQVQPLVGYTADGFDLIPVLGDPVTVNGLRLIDGRASYGFGLQSFMLGFPMHFDWSWRTLFNRQWEDLLFRSCNQSGAAIVCSPDGGSFRKMQFDFWIGYDF
jgi:outer membrane protein assembly factor BamA